MLRHLAPEPKKIVNCLKSYQCWRRFSARIFQSADKRERFECRARQFCRARHHADDEAPGWRLEVRDLAGPLRTVRPPELKPAPKLGQHTDEVMASWLKMSPGDVAKLKSEKIIGNT
jgi:crotonobetainyl-CoA:carnitine CoA-transferase CaiB-like acyl-CoA transferase